MAFVEWEITSLTTGRSTTDEAKGFYFGTKYGQAGYWLKIPDSVPAIQHMILTATPVASGGAGGGDGGLYFVAYYSTIPVERIVYVQTCKKYEKGGRWICASASGTTIGVVIAAGAHKKKVRLYYKGVNEAVGPTA